MTKEEEMLITKNTTLEKKFCSCVWPKEQTMSATDFCGCDSSSPHHELGYLNGSSLFGFCSIATMFSKKV
jgi:hypothetical protein